MNVEVEREEPVVTSSTDSDTAAPVQEPAKAESSTEQNQTDSTAELADGEQAPETHHDDDKAPLPKGVQRKINKLTRKAGDAERTAREYALELELARERLKQFEQPQQRQQQAPPQENGKPTLEQFDFDQDRYLEALADYRLDHKLGELRQQAEERKAQESAQERQRRLSSLESAFVAEHPDYEDVAKDPSVPITKEMADAIVDSDIAPAIAYYLGQNIEEAASIAQLSPVAQGRAIGRIEAKLSAPTSTDSGQPPFRTTKAPPPVTTLNSAAPIGKALEDIKDMEEYAAERKKQRTARGLT